MNAPGTSFEVSYDQPACGTAHAWARVPVEPPPAERARLLEAIAQELRDRNALLVAHYYVHPDLQDLAEATGGIVADSLEMARFGRDSSATTLVVAGVRFMGETAKLLSPDKTILVPEMDANCSLDLGCPAPEFTAFCDAHPDHEVVVYANTSAAVKARADWMVTSAIALPIVRHLAAQGRPILWAPDRHLGAYIQRETGARMLMWNGACIVHDEFKTEELAALKRAHPEARVLVHPESPASVIALADAVGSTGQILKAAREMEATTFIVATDNGMLHKLRQQNPGKTFLEAPTAGNSATCKSCAHCPWMAMNGLAAVHHVLTTGSNAIEIDPALAARARLPIDRMLAFAAEHGTGSASVRSATGDQALDARQTGGIGPA